MRVSRTFLLLVVGISCLYTRVASDDKTFEVNGDRLSESVADDDEKLSGLDSGQKRASWLDFKRSGGQEYDGSDDDEDEAKRASWLDFKRAGADKRASWLDFKRGGNSGLKAWLDNKRASWLDFKKRASWLDFKRSHGDLSDDKRASWLDMKRDMDKRASWLDFKRSNDKRASWLDFKRANDKRASWLDMKRNGVSQDDQKRASWLDMKRDSSDGLKRASWLDMKRNGGSADEQKRASWLDMKRALGSWIEAREKQKRGGADNTMDADTIKVIREMLLKDKPELKPSMRKELLESLDKATKN